MALQNQASITLFLSLNLLFFALVTGTDNCGTLKLGVCANVLNLVNIVVGSPPTLPCCSLIQGLVSNHTYFLCSYGCAHMVLKTNFFSLV
ncbi:hypothetical protein MTR67_013529 [Solanum verrucosum]|uniref:Hydrophobic seed protein domain-containing protein n=1 Tax=Solanum verrucosum TaxID=315347 RepID=A0AAF0QAL6_SOLVR|nr:hypothetical protein MTR67_013529 [Solanum verrucosum]